jgi:peptidoglycan/LPS O-acetylase OafA/YrhL
MPPQETGVGKAAPITYLPYLDGLRALSILLVLFYHAHGKFGQLGEQFSGWVGVDVFFVLSGFLITSLLVQERAKYGTISFSGFYMRRLLRIAPAYYVFLLVMLLAQGWAAAGSVAVCAVYLSNYNMALRHWELVETFGLGHTWSLAVEEQFYLLWPIALYLANRRALRLTVVLTVAVALYRGLLVRYGVSPDRVYFAFDTRVDTLLIGCIAALLWAEPSYRERIRQGLTGPWTALVVLGGLFFAFQTLGLPWQGRVYKWAVYLPLTVSLIAVLVLALLVNPTSLLARVLSHPVLVWIGRLSYSLYLWHPPAYDVAKELSPWLAEHFPGGSFWAKATVADALGMLLGFGLACLSYYVVEMPFLKLKKLWQGAPVKPAPAPLALEAAPPVVN